MHHLFELFLLVMWFSCMYLFPIHHTNDKLTFLSNQFIIESLELGVSVLFQYSQLVHYLHSSCQLSIWYRLPRSSEAVEI